MRAEELTEEVKDSLQRAAAWLVRQQGEDGGWHSTTYGQLKDGAGVTALILYSLRHESFQANGKRVAEAVRRGFEFLGQGIAKRGTIASPDGTLDFPTYAAALWLEADRAVRLAGRFSADRYKLVEYLVAAQVKEERSFESKSPSYGGWDFLGK